MLSTTLSGLAVFSVMIECPVAATVLRSAFWLLGHRA
jgi:hypothetical protein